MAKRRKDKKPNAAPNLRSQPTSANMSSTKVVTTITALINLSPLPPPATRDDVLNIVTHFQDDNNAKLEKLKKVLEGALFVPEQQTHDSSCGDGANLGDDTAITALTRRAGSGSLDRGDSAGFSRMSLLLAYRQTFIMATLMPRGYRSATEYRFGEEQTDTIVQTAAYHRKDYSLSVI
ncbi:hypothetical protein CC80DRAFT_534315 [Byssothecium circinans]|uniref:Uncharacterized protein n=1 Tax=Byssothecium circinans TaxID=147558 RepID=A0A6A5U474_9PLEO|nr:hypothetical protein CC80DRAFT_534315 [Byssothecium circinans]